MKNNSIVAIAEKLSQWLLVSLLVFVPLLVVPYTRNLIVDTKVFLVFLTALVVLLGFGIRTLMHKKWEVAVSPLSFPLVLFGLMVLLSTFLANRYPAEGLLGFGGLYLSLVLIGIFGSSMVKGNHAETAVKVTGVGAALLSISMLLQQFGWGPTRLINAVSAFNLPHSLLFNLSGSSFVAIQVILIALVGLIAVILKKKAVSLTDMALGTSLLVGLGLGVWSVLPGKIAAITLTPLSASWTVMVRSLSSWQGALIGHGPASYANIYARFKPLWTNGADFWQFNFGTATNTPFTLIVTLGALGALAWLFLAAQTMLQLRRSTEESKPLLWMLLASFVIQLLVPTNVVVLALQIPLFVFWIAANQSHFSLLQFKSIRFRAYPAKLEFMKRFAKKGDWFVRVTSLLIVAAVIGLGYLLTRAYTAYFYMYQANRAFAAQDAVQVYENQRLAVRSNPYLDSLRREYAYTNLQVAIALANNADLTETERQQVVQLISQAIREGKAATLLDPDDVDNWMRLGEVYRNLIGVADEANTWSVNSFVSAVQVNPINPLIRLEIGQLMLNDGNAQDAIRFFAQAAELKPDLVAAYYQLGLGFKELGQLEDTRKAWQRALLLLPNDSQDYLILTNELENLSAQDSSAAPAEEETAPNVTEQNVQQQESDVINPGEDAAL